MQGKSIEIIVDRSGDSRNPYSTTLPISSISYIDLPIDHNDPGQLKLHGRDSPIHCESRKLTLARLAWIDLCAEGPNFDDPVANPTMALTMAKAGSHSQGLDEASVIKAISLWFTPVEITKIERLAHINSDPASKKIEKNLGQIGVLIAVRSRELRPQEIPELIETIAARRADIGRTTSAPIKTPGSRG